jgi:hypothetical protein
LSMTEIDHLFRRGSVVRFVYHVDAKATRISN